MYSYLLDVAIRFIGGFYKKSTKETIKIKIKIKLFIKTGTCIENIFVQPNFYANEQIIQRYIIKPFSETQIQYCRLLQKLK